MAVVAVKSAQITNRDATPMVRNNARTAGGRLMHKRAIVAITSGDSSTSTYRLFEIPSNAVVVSVRVSSPDIGTTTAADIGIYQTTANGGAVVDADHFASAVSLSGGAISKSDVTHEAAVYTLANGEKPLWDALGLTADTLRGYDVVATLTGAADATGTALFEIDYTV
jgi:hypothetical protein